MTDRSITMLVHGESGVGKTWLGDTTPAPRLVFDAEGGTKFTGSKKVRWNPLEGAPPEADGSWETCVVTVTSFDTMTTGFQWLQSGKHPFRSVTLDSLTEIQKRCLDSISGTNQPEMQDWGALLRKMEGLVRSFRDLTLHPTNPMEAIVIIAMTQNKDERFRPFVQGSLATTLPYFVDVVGYLYVDRDPETDERRRRLLVQPVDRYDAKDRTNRLGTVVNEPNVKRMLDSIFGTNDTDAGETPADDGDNA